MKWHTTILQQENEIVLFIQKAWNSKNKSLYHCQKFIMFPKRVKNTIFFTL